jgi:hypothetical protein
MKLNEEEENDTPQDPIDLIPENVMESLVERSATLASWMSNRQKHYENFLQGDVTDSSTMALTERLAFYEITIDAMILRQADLENRLGGSINKGGNN